MNWRTILLILVAIISATYSLHAFHSHREEGYREDGWDAWQSSNGTMDDEAVRSYKKITRVPKRNRTYTDEFILDQILNTNLPNSAEPGSRAGAVAVAEDGSDTCMDTLALLNDSPQVRFPGTTPNRPNRALHPLFVLDRIEARFEGIPGVETRDLIQRCRKEYVDNARRTVPENTEDDETTPQKAKERVLDAGVSYTSDPQNVHDNAANISFRKTLQRLKWDRGGDNTVSQKEVAQSIEECMEYIENGGARDENDKGMLRLALNRIAQGHSSTTFNDSEDRIFATVWDRTKTPTNVATKRSDLIKLAILDAMRDMVDGGNLVCINGRCGRLLDSLTLVDHDKDLGNARTVEMVRNEIIEKSKVVLSECIAEAANSNRAYMKAIAQEYTDPLSNAIDESPAAETAKSDFERNLNERVSVMIDGYRTDVSPKELENIRDYCLAAVAA